MATQDAQVMTYTKLISDVLSYSERNDEAFINQIPRFILLAEKTIASEFKTLWEINVARTTLLQEQETIQKPARWRETISITVNNLSMYVRSAEMVKYYGSQLPAGRPQYWCDYDYNNILVAPTPDQTYTFELTYFEQAPPLSIENEENLLTREVPQLLLFGTMVQAAYWEKSVEKIGYWTQQYQVIKQSLTQEDKFRSIDRNTTVESAG